MPHYGALSETRFQQRDDADDLRGSEVYGVNNEKLGKIDDVIFDHATGDIRYVVVETGGLFSKKSFLVPANRVSLYGNHEDKFYADLDKERIQMLPEYDEKALKSEENWSKYEKHYHDQWKDGEVMYNTSTGRMITPPIEQVPAAPVASVRDPERLEEVRKNPQRVGREDELLGVGTSRSATLKPKKPSIAGREDAILAEQEANARSLSDQGVANPGIVEVDDEMLMERDRTLRAEREGLTQPGNYRADAVPDAEKASDLNEPLNANYGPRWNKFQSRLREQRADAVSECPLCGRQRKIA